MISRIENLIIFLSYQDFYIILLHSFIVSFLFCIPFTFFMYDKYIEKKPMSHKEAWYPYISILFCCTLFNIYKVYSYNCEPKCLYIFGHLEFITCCTHKWIV